MENGPKQSDAIETLLYSQAKTVVESFDDVPTLEDFEKNVSLATSSVGKTAPYYKDKPKEFFNNKLETCMRECVVACRAALGVKADYIIVLDSSARPYGYIFNKLVKMLGLEYAKINGILIENVKIPEIKYINPPYRSRLVDDEQIEMLKKMIPEGSINLVFDESSGGRGFVDNGETVNEQYATKIKPISPNNLSEWDFDNIRSVHFVSRELTRTTKSVNYGFVGNHDTAGGNFRDIYSELYEGSRDERRVGLPVTGNSQEVEGKIVEHDWLSKTNEDVSLEAKERVYKLARMISAFIIRDIFEKSFTNQAN